MSSPEKEMEEKTQKMASEKEDQTDHWKPKVDLMSEEVTNYSPRKLETMLKEGFTPWKPIMPSAAVTAESSTTNLDKMSVEEGSAPKKIEIIPKLDRPGVLDAISRPSVSASLPPEIRYERERREMSVSPARKTITDHSKDAEPITASERADLKATIARKTVAPIAPLSLTERRELLRSISVVGKEPETPLWFSGDTDDTAEGIDEETEMVEEQPMHRAPELTMARSRFAPPLPAAVPTTPIPEPPSAPILRYQRAASSRLTRVPTKRVFPMPNLKDEEVLNPFSKKERKALVRSLSMAVTSTEEPLWRSDLGDSRESDDGRPRDEERLKPPLLLPPELDELKKAKDYGKLPLDVRQVLLRGATLRNTDWILGVVVYTGADTKFVRNMIPGQRKVTELEKNMNILVAVVFGCQLALCIGLSTAQDQWMRKNTNLFYAPYNIFSEQVGVVPSEIGAQFGRFLILLDQLIPISLYVTLELVKVIQSYFLDHDLQMYHEPTDTFARARTTSLNEELGQVQYVMTDKTGTLTQNLMAFVQCSVNGAIYGNPTHVAKASDGGKRPTVHSIIEDANLQSVLKHIAEGSKEPAAKSCHAFFSHLAICHVIQPVEGNYGKPAKTPKEQRAKEAAAGQGNERFIRYVGPSPDEEALVQGSAECGYRLKKRTGDELQVEMPGRGLQKFAVLATLEFTSERKRMSIICRDSRGRSIHLTLFPPE